MKTVFRVICVLLALSVACLCSGCGQKAERRDRRAILEEMVVDYGSYGSEAEAHIRSLLKELGARMVISRAESDVQAKFLLRNGADEVIDPEKQMARWTAIRYSADHLLDYIELDDSHSIFEVSTPASWIGKTVGQVDVRNRYKINIMALKKNGKMDTAIAHDTVLTGDATLLVLGSYKDVQKCFHI